ncbi:hypothetical protein [Cedecea neteri]|nr:hypothetical protein [Cedecea neteri]
MMSLSQLIAISLLFLSGGVSAQNCPKIISAISHGKTIAQVEVPTTVGIEVSGDEQSVNADNTLVLFKGDSKLSLTFPSGEILKMQSDNITIRSCIPDSTTAQKQAKP